MQILILGYGIFMLISRIDSNVISLSSKSFVHSTLLGKRS